MSSEGNGTLSDLTSDFDCREIHTLQSLTIDHSWELREIRNIDDVRRHFRSSTKVTEEQHQVWISNYLTREDEHMWVLLCNQKVIAAAALYAIQATEAKATFGRLMTDPGRRNKHRGAGRFMVRHAIHVAMAMDLVEVTLEVQVGNHRAIDLYLSEGFKDANEVDGYLEMVRALK